MSQANIFLRTLDLSYNGLGKDGAVALGEALKDNNTLEDLNIRYKGFWLYLLVMLIHFSQLTLKVIKQMVLI